MWKLCIICIVFRIFWALKNPEIRKNPENSHACCLLNRLFRRRSKKTSKLRITGLCAGNSLVTGEFPAQMASNAKNVSIWWRHHALTFVVCWPCLLRPLLLLSVGSQALGHTSLRSRCLHLQDVHNDHEEREWKTHPTVPSVVLGRTLRLDDWKIGAYWGLNKMADILQTKLSNRWLNVN